MSSSSEWCVVHGSRRVQPNGTWAFKGCKQTMIERKKEMQQSRALPVSGEMVLSHRGRTFVGSPSQLIRYKHESRSRFFPVLVPFGFRASHSGLAIHDP